MLIGHENRGPIQSPLPQNSSGRSAVQTTQRHRQITAPGQDINRVDVDETSAVIPNVDHHAVASVLFSIQVDAQLIQRPGSHIKHVYIAQSSITDSGDVLTVLLNPLTVQQSSFRGGVHRPYR